MKNFITFEGCEGVGKTTQLRFLKEYCREKGIDALFTREPGGSIIAEKIRDIILDGENKTMTAQCEALLYAAARNQHLHDTVIPALEKGSVVFCDRFTDSTYAYQGFARGLGVDFVEKLNAVSVGRFMPQFTVFLALEPRAAFARKGGADVSDRIESEGSSFHTNVYEGYLNAIAKDKERFIVINAEGSKYETHEKIVSELIQKGILR